MKRILIFSAASLLAFASCRKVIVDGDGNGSGAGTSVTNESTVLSGKIEDNLTLRAGRTYTLRSMVYVVNGATLTIEPGTTIVGDYDTRGTLIITRGSRINATGTATQPIVFTSSRGTAARSGDWGGIVILGRARTNAVYNGQAGLGEAEGGINNDGNGLFGGTDDNDNSGTLKYVRIEYAGYAFLPDKELNGLGLYAVGKGTTISHVEVAWAADDSFEWFGGAVNADHIIAYKGLDDDFDTDNGFSGKVQFAISIRDSSVADVSGSNGFESDNDAAGSTLTPQTSAIFANVTSVGPKESLTSVGNTFYRNAAQIRRNSSISVINSVFMGWNNGLLIDASTGRPTDLNITGTTPTLWWRGNIIAGVPGAANQVKYSASTAQATGWTAADALAWHNTASFNNLLLATNTEVGYGAAFNYNNPDFSVAATSPLLTGAYPSADARFFGLSAATYRGAVGPNDTWYKGWTRFGN